VWDTGPGIAESQRERIFEEFQRLDTGCTAGADEPHGAGLGLAIVRQIGRVLDVSVDVRSWPGYGSVFSAEVPLDDGTTHAASESPDDHEATFHGRLIWIASDDDDAPCGVQVLQHGWGCVTRLLSVTQLAHAVETAEPKPDLLLLDQAMIATSAFQRLLAWNHDGAISPHIIMLSDDACADLRNDCRERGWGLLSKPLRPSALRAVMSRLLEVPDERDDGGQR